MHVAALDGRDDQVSTCSMPSAMQELEEADITVGVVVSAVETEGSLHRTASHQCTDVVSLD